MANRDKLFFVGQKALIERDGSVLVLFYNGTHIDLPGGKVQEGEALTTALQREIHEETALAVEVGTPFATDLSSDGAVYFVAYRCRYVSGDVILSDEHESYRWVHATEYERFADGSPQSRLLAAYFDAADHERLPR